MTIMSTDPTPSPRIAAAQLPQVAARPDPSQWAPDEPLSLHEAAALFFPDGEPLSLTSLRNAVREGKLGIAVVAGKFLTTPAAIQEMLRPSPHGRAAPPPIDAPPPARIAGVVASSAIPPRARASPSRGISKLEKALARSAVQR